MSGLAEAAVGEDADREVAGGKELLTGKVGVVPEGARPDW